MGKKHKTTLVFAFVILLISYNLYKLSNPLYRAYIINSDDRIKAYFEEWNKSYSTNYPLLNNDTIKAIYEIFDAFYTPREMKRIGKSEWGDSIYITPKYLLVQNTIYYSVLLKSNHYYDSILSNSYYVNNYNDTMFLSNLRATDSIHYFQMLQNWKYDDSRETETCIKDFRPKTIYPDDEILYEDRKYYPKIAKYLGYLHFDFGFPNLMSPAQPKRSNRNKQDFLNPYLVVWHGHWGGYWHITSHPLVWKIILENDLETADVHFLVVYQSGTATLKKEEGVWKLIESELTGIE